MMRALYTFLIALMLPFALIRLYWRGRKNPGYRKFWGERFGSVPFKLNQCIWVHAVSLGETIAAEPLVKRLLKDYPEFPIVLTSMTPTGRTRAMSLQSERVQVCHLPYDLPWLLKRFYRAVRPKLLVIMETELWPNLIISSQRHGIPVVLANARLSAGSAKGYAYIKGFTRTMLQHFAAIAAQNSEDGARFVALGLPANKLTITGSIKFDLSIPEGVLPKAEALKSMWPQRPVWIAASTHQGEEALILAAQRHVLEALPDSLLIIVPRHPERFAEVNALCLQLGFSVVCRSSHQPCSIQTQVYLGDTMGELLVYYASSQIAYVGGSLVNTGGHNPLEPAALSLPVIMGPHTFNFRQISRLLLKAGASLSVDNSEQLAQEVINLLQNPERRQAMGAQGYQTVIANRGALDRLMGTLQRAWN